MKFELDENVLNFLKVRRQADVTLDLEEIPSNCCLGRLPEIRISPASPRKPEHYRHFSTQGINIYVSKALRTQETLTFYLSGIGRFKKLEVAGINLIL